MLKKSYKGRRIKLAAKKSLAVPVAIVTSFIVILAVSLSTLINKGLVNAFSDSVTPNQQKLAQAKRIKLTKKRLKKVSLSQKQQENR